MKKDKKKFYIIAISILLLAGIYSFVFMELKGDYEIGETYVEDIEHDPENFKFDKKMNEKIIINDYGIERSIKSENKIFLELSGENNNIYFDKDTDVGYIILKGANNNIFLCKAIHSPTVSKTGENQNIIYSEC